MDFNPWGEKTDPLLFDWEEDLFQADTSKPLKFKCIESNDTIRDRGIGKYKVPVVSRVDILL